ncbi:unnamed protein product [Dracunculus medinensis]|uniref:Methylenetetrahydrofolate reductase [NAD(P)H] n=1 Tax=Dracunculus medinensis TaxID=318479 RepID=A0A0N4UK25_DRAME|nr:unnamed protein product [Dracunculus medinensis]
MNGLSSSSVLDATSECTTDGLNSSNGHKKTAHAKISPLLDSELFERSLYIPLHNRINQRIQDGSPFFSLEFFPPKTVNGVSNFFSRVERMREGNPLFVDVTWHTGSDPGNLKKETSSTSIAAGCLNYCAVDTMLHMSCINYSKKQTLRHLEQSKIAGLRNILALRGDLQKQIGIRVRCASGESLLRFAEQYELFVTNTYLRYQSMWNCADNQHSNKIDYILISRHWKRCILDTRSYRDANNFHGSDVMVRHKIRIKLIICKFNHDALSVVPNITDSPVEPYVRNCGPPTQEEEMISVIHKLKTYKTRRRWSLGRILQILPGLGCSCDDQISILKKIHIETSLQVSACHRQYCQLFYRLLPSIQLAGQFFEAQ